MMASCGESFEEEVKCPDKEKSEHVKIKFFSLKLFPHFFLSTPSQKTITQKSRFLPNDFDLKQLKRESSNCRAFIAPPHRIIGQKSSFLHEVDPFHPTLEPVFPVPLGKKVGKIGDFKL